MYAIFNIYDKNETNFTTFGLAILKDVKNPLIRRKINGDYKLTFEYPITPDDEKLQYIEKENIIKVEGQLFRIQRTVKKDTEYQQWIEVLANHIFFDLIDCFTEDNRAVGATAEMALQTLLQGTPYTVGQCDDLGVNTAYFIEENKLKSINDKIIPRWGAEIEIDNFTVAAKKRIGQDRKYHIRRGKNLKGINYTEDISSVVTRLYVKGKDGLTIESVNNGKKYIDSPLINNYAHIKTDSITFSEVEDPLELLHVGQEHLETIDKPYIHYEIDLLELRESEQYKHFKELEKFCLGDTVYIYNDKLNIDIEARILEYEYNPKTRKNSRVVLGNFTQRLEDVLGRFEDTKRKVDISITDDGYVRTGWLQGEINALVNRIIASGAYQHAQVRENEGVLFENTEETSDDFGAMYIGPGIFAIADSKKADNTWDWRTFGTGKGFTADLMTTGKLKGNIVHITPETTYEVEEEYTLERYAEMTLQEIIDTYGGDE